jgi:hypothetical protein
MARQLYIVAMPLPSAMPYGKDDLKDDRLNTRNAVTAHEDTHKLGVDPLSYAMIEYESIEDLCTRIGNQMQAGDTLADLELSGHGSPRGCALLNVDRLGGTGGYAQELMALRWDEPCNLYLSGCNTGTTDKKGGVSDSLAKQVAAAMKLGTPVESKQNMPFDRHMTVWGTLGYFEAWSSGTHLALGSNQVRAVKRGSTDATAYDGAKDANGQACWVGEPNT